MASTRRPIGPRHGVFDFSDMSLEDSRMEKMRNIQARSLGQVTLGQNRILKRHQTMDDKYLMPKEETTPGRGPRLGSRPPTISSKTRANEALRKLAQIETKIRSRRQAPTALSDTESDSKTSERRSQKGTDAASDVSSQHPHRTFQKQACKSPMAKSDGQREQGSRFLKRREPPTEARSLEPMVEKGKSIPPPRQKEPVGKCDAPDSDEEEMKMLLRSLTESSREKETNMNQVLTGTKARRSDPGKLTSDPPPAQPEVLSLLSVDPSSSKPSHPSPQLDAPWTLNAGDTASLTSSPFITNDLSKSASSKMGCIKLASSPSRSEVGSSEESVSEAADDSLHDFRINILSIEDLVLADGEKSDVEQKGEGMSGRSSPPMSPARLEEQRAARHKSSAFQGVVTVVAEEEGLATEVSEHLGDSSAEAVQSPSVSSVPSVETPTALEASLAYSEDFEQYSDPLASEASLERTLDTSSQLSFSGQTDRLPRPSPKTKWGQGVAGVMKETAVQTLDPAFAAGSMAAIGPTLGGAYVDPAPIASHIVSADAIEALTAYSPAVLVLNDMLKQQLSLTQQFIEASRHLHVSLLRSLDGETFHYHTLEETREVTGHSPGGLAMGLGCLSPQAGLHSGHHVRDGYCALPDQTGCSCLFLGLTLESTLPTLSFLFSIIFSMIFIEFYIFLSSPHCLSPFLQPFPKVPMLPIYLGDLIFLYFLLPM